MSASSLLEQIAAAPALDCPIALVVAHPDDETVWLGSRLSALRRLKIIQLTDGAPRRLDDALRAGFADSASYAAARRGETEAALATLGAAAERIAYGHRDQESIDALEPIVGALVADLDGVDAVLTHPYEHGHPDHDTAALAVALACRRHACESGRCPERFEFASYHLRQGRAAYGVFWPDPTCPERRIELDAHALARKQQAVACHASQADTLAPVPLAPERLRRAPDYDFAAAAPPRDCLYGRYGWAMTGERWRAIAARAWLPAPEQQGDDRWRAVAMRAAGR